VLDSLAATSASGSSLKATAFSAGSLENRCRKPSETLSHCWLALFASGWAKTVRMVAPTILLDGLGHQREGIPHEVNPTPLPGGPYQDRLNGALQTPMGVAGYEPHPTESSGDQRTQEGALESAFLAAGPTSKPNTSLAPVCSFTPTAMTTATEATCPSWQALR